ncbi:MAG: CBS domain-containing protein [Alphaproteobacteria bacterium]|nr:CBS domain-containing protein [Alphaproteobacteria bacterium]
MQHAIDIMNREPLLVSPDLSVGDLARKLLEADVDGACVVKDGKLVGVVTSMDLVFQDKQVHLPTMIAFIDALIPIGAGRTKTELEKITASTVREIMTTDVKKVPFDAPLDEIATLMVEHHITLVPVVRDGRVLGTITKKDVLRAHYGG